MAPALITRTGRNWSSGVGKKVLGKGLELRLPQMCRKLEVAQGCGGLHRRQRWER
jgi:hypothetical protein